MSAGNVQLEKERQAFLKGAWKPITDQMRAKCFAAKKTVVMQLLVFSLKPMTADKRAAGTTRDEYESPHLRGKDRTMKVAQNSIMNAVADLLRLVLAVHAHPNNVLASFDVSHVFLNAELSEHVVILTQPAPELIKFGLVKAGALYQCTKACYGLREALKLWEETRDKTLKNVTFQHQESEYNLHQSAYHPSL